MTQLGYMVMNDGPTQPGPLACAGGEKVSYIKNNCARRAGAGAGRDAGRALCEGALKNQTAAYCFTKSLKHRAGSYWYCSTIPPTFTVQSGLLVLHGL